MSSAVTLTSEMSTKTAEAETTSVNSLTSVSSMTFAMTTLTPEAQVSVDALSAAMFARVWPTVVYLGLLILLGVAGNVLIFSVSYTR